MKEKLSKIYRECEDLNYLEMVDLMAELERLKMDMGDRWVAEQDEPGSIQSDIQGIVAASARLSELLETCKLIPKQ